MVYCSYGYLQPVKLKNEKYLEMKNKSADGLRGIAALNVAICHFVAAFLPTMLYKNYLTAFPENLNPSLFFEFVTSAPISIVYNGHFAVLIFFVLSGYVLTIPFFSNQINSRPVLEKRLLGRYLRLNIPIAVAVAAAYIIYTHGLYSITEAATISGSVNWAKSFYPQGVTAWDAAKEAIYEPILFGKSTLVPPLWTLRIEFIGSIYLLLFYITKPNETVFIPLTIVLFFIYVIYRQDSIYYYAIFAGSLLSYFKNIKRYRFIIFVLGFYFGGFQFTSLAYDYLPNLNIVGAEIWEKKTFYNAIGAVFITLSVVQGFGSIIFESRLAQFLGRISFSLYLTHFIILCSLSSFVYIKLPQGNLFLTANFCGYLIVCFIVSVFFEKIVDRNSINVSHKFSSKIYPERLRFSAVCTNSPQIPPL